VDAPGAVAVSSGAVAAPPALARLTRLADDVYLTLHVAPMGFTLVLPLLGAAAAGESLGGARTAALLALAASFHLFAYGLNDVMDLPIDRTEPLRAGDPLVRGALSPGTLLWLALLQLPVMGAIAAGTRLSPRAVAALVVAVACLAAYDRWGKTASAPLATDAVQGAGWAALLLVGVPAGAPLSGRPAVAAVMVVLYILLVNGVVGPLRDLPNDFARGARTTAIVLGARPRGAGVHVPAPVAAYAFALHAAVTAGGLVLLRDAARPAWWLACALGAAATLLMAGAGRALRSPAHLVWVGGAWIATSLAFLIIAAAHRAAAELHATLQAAFVIPVALMFLRRWLVTR
jgi:4-hydroxybenzoate polyprenyltransferase